MENEWIARIQQGDSSGYGPLLEPYQTLLHGMALRFCCNGGIVSRAELEQAGYLGLMRAAQRYDTKSGVQFITYAFPWALGEMKRVLKKSLPVSGIFEKRHIIAQQESRLCASLSRQPKLSELATACGMNEQEIIQVLEASAPQSLDCADAEDTSPLLDRLPGKENVNFETLDLRMAIEKLPQMERSVLILRFFRGNTQHETARTLGKSQAQISKLENHALDLLRSYLK